MEAVSIRVIHSGESTAAPPCLAQRSPHMAISTLQQQFRYTQTPSQVLHRWNLPWECIEEELIELCKPFGKIVNTKCNVGANRNQAFVEFVDLNQAINMVTYYASSSEPAQIRGKTVYIQYSNTHEIVNNKSPGDVPGNVLLVIIEGVEAGDVSIDVIHLIFGGVGIGCLPLGLIFSFIRRPKAVITRSQYIKEATDLSKRARELKKTTDALPQEERSGSKGRKWRKNIKAVEKCSCKSCRSFRSYDSLLHYYVLLSDPLQYQSIVDAEWNIIYDKLDKCVQSGAKVVLSRLAIGDLATQW
ncbi:hypothetical protein ACS0TY_028469 [Phlomoides rotata]